MATSLLDEGLGFLFWDFQLNQEYQVEAPGIADSALIITSFHQSSQPIELRFGSTTDGKQVREPMGSYFHKGTADYLAIVPRHTRITGCYIVFDRAWFIRNLPNGQDAYRWIEQIGEGGISRPLLNTHQVLLIQMGEGLQKPFFGALQVKSAVYSLLITALESFVQQTASGINFDQINKADLRQILAVEQQLINDLSHRPPTIQALAAEFGMSDSKLKNLFRRVFGKGLYEHYQSCRMKKAHELIFVQGMGVTQAGRSLGYRNLSNFSIAFKKEFGYLPSHPSTGGAG
jgi:AraC-like DNA-binding protein